MRRYNLLAGRVFGNLTVFHRDERVGGNARWLCRCTCGKEKVVRSDRLLDGRQKSCAIDGHYWNATPSSRFKKQHRPEYGSWLQMRRRCLEKKHKKYKHYGARGVTICERWSTFENFFEDMGAKPTPKHTIDRKDVNGNYEPGNCYWATAVEQGRHLRRSIYVEHQGERQLLMDVVDRAGLNRQVVYGRLKMGWSLEDALTVPVRAKRKNRPKKKRQQRKRNVVAPTTPAVI